MKNTLIWIGKFIATVVAIIIALLIVLYLGGLIKLQKDLGVSTSYYNKTVPLLGTFANLCKVPLAYYWGNSTSTAGYTDGCTVYQLIETEGVDTVKLNVMAKGGTATSTLSIRPMISNDGTNYFDLTNATTTPQTTVYGVSTSTLALGPSTFEYDPSVATTSKSFNFEVSGAKYVRFVLLGEDVSTDPDDGVKAWIEAIALEPID